MAGIDGISETLQERQDNEIEALKAIFGPSELHDTRTDDAWRVSRPPEIVLTLKPQQGSSGPGEVHAHIDLHVTCGSLYPDEVPRIKLERSKGLSIQQVSQLSEELLQLAQQLKGEVMIFELAQHVQKFLLGFNKPGFKSFYEEMLSRKAQQEKQKQLLRQQEQDRERQALQEQIQLKQQALREEQRRRRAWASSSPSPTPPTHEGTSVTQGGVQRSHSSSYIQTAPFTRQRTRSSCGSGDNIGCDHGGPQLLRFGSERQVLRGQCLGHGSRGSEVFAAQDMQNGELLAVSQWRLSCVQPRRKGSQDEDLHPEHAALLKQLSGLEHEANVLLRLSHPGLVRCLAVNCENKRDELCISLLQDFVQGVSLSFFLDEALPMGLDLLRHVTRGALEALSFLHNNNVVHRDLRHSCIFLHHAGGIMISDFSLDKRLSELMLGAGGERGYCGLPPALGRGGKKADVHRLGSLLISLIRGAVVTEMALAPPPGLPMDLHDFLQKCLHLDEHQRWSTQQLLEHSFVRVRSPMEAGLSIHQGLDLGMESPGSPEEADPDPRLLLSNGGRNPSRVQTEFEVLQWLGKGAFGDVLKVKNKLDGRMYALKRIKLNPRNKVLNRKITREVKLLSRLNHENVVRYYNSWIESAVIVEAPSTEGYTPSESLEAHEPGCEQGLDASVKWNVSYDARPRNVNLSDEDSSSDEEEPWIAFYPPTDSSSSIVFEGPDDASSVGTSAEQETPLSHSKDVPSPESRELQFMYIQMEFCEKSTLRNAIDNGLSCDEARVWRLFREMVEGLAHIHQQGMIHRDLKPVNVFLDLHDHVKIGDFGLATSNVRQALDQPEPVPSEASLEAGEGALTGQVGTALYTAPELTGAPGKAVFYNQKVDIYSLGIIFFEMSHPKLETAMERVKVLLALRSPQIIFPSDFSEDEHPQHAYLIKWLLNHEPGQRPSAQELLQAECLLPLQHEEAHLQQVMRHTLSNPQSKAYKHLVGACLAQSVPLAEDITYDMGLTKSVCALSLHALVREAVERVFSRHGALRIATPLLLPRSASQEPPEGHVLMMTHSGSVVMLPHDLRVAFARYAAWNHITSLKRYSIERVFRERRVFGLHPRELYEGAFDVVTPSAGCALAEGELLAVVCEVLAELPALRSRSCVVRINHTSLLRALLLHCGVEEERHAAICVILSEARDGTLSKPQVQTRLTSLCLPRPTLSSLTSLLDCEGPLHQASQLRALGKGKGVVATLAKEGLRHLEAVLHSAEALGVKCSVVVAPGLVLDPVRYSGTLCQVTCELRKGRHGRSAQDVIAAGGGYSHMLAHFRNVLDRASGSGAARDGGGAGACGISLSLDKLAAALQGEAVTGGGVADALVCSPGPHSLLREKAGVARELWAAGVRALLLDSVQTIEEAQALSRELSVPHLILVSYGEANTVRVRSFERDRLNERKVSISELAEFLAKQLRQNGTTSGEMSTSSASEFAPTPSMASTSGLPIINTHFITSEKLAFNTRRRYENQIMGQIASSLRLLSPRASVEVLGLSLEAGVLRTLAATIDLSAGEEPFNLSLAAVVDKHPRHRKYFAQIGDKLHELRFEKNAGLFLLYSLPDSVFKLVL